MAVLHENDPDANSASVARVEEKFISFSPLNQKEEALTPESSSISFNQWQLIIFSSPRNYRLCFWINVYCFIFIPSFFFIMINPNSSLFCLSYFAPPIVHWSVSLGSKIRQIPFPIKEYLTLLLACFEGNLFWFKTAKTERRCEREEENLKGRSKLKNQSRLEVNVVSQMHQNCFLK